MNIIRKATIDDIEEIHNLIMNFANKNLMLPKLLSEVCDSLRDFFVAEYDGKIVACGALKIFLNNLAEIRSLATNENFQHQGFGKKIIEALLDDARSLKIYDVFTLSYQVDFFKNLGFSLIKKRRIASENMA